MPTGAEILQSLSFQNRPTGDAVFGLSMLLIGFLTSAIVILDRSKLSYTPLGHVGSKQLAYPEENDKEVAVTTPDSKGDGVVSDM